MFANPNQMDFDKLLVAEDTNLGQRIVGLVGEEHQQGR